MKAAELKALFTGYWQYLPLKAACKLDLFDWIAAGYDGLSDLSEQLQADSSMLDFLLQALVELKAIQQNEAGDFELAETGALLCEKHPQSLKYACILWAEEHLSAWQQLEWTVKHGKPAFEQLYQSAFFDYLQENSAANRIYHRAMYEYARDDYRELPLHVDLSAHRALLDVGGGLGALLQHIHRALPKLPLYLFEQPQVAALHTAENNFCTVLPGDFFESIPTVADGIVLSRVLHDWPDEEALLILENAAKALPKSGRLYLIELLKETVNDGAHLLNLNMQLICHSFERSLEEYEKLLSQKGFQLLKTVPLTTLPTVLIAEKL